MCLQHSSDNATSIETNNNNEEKTKKKKQYYYSSTPPVAPLYISKYVLSVF